MPSLPISQLGLREDRPPLCYWSKIKYEATEFNTRKREGINRVVVPKQQDMLEAFDVFSTSKVGHLGTCSTLLPILSTVYYHTHTQRERERAESREQRELSNR